MQKYLNTLKNTDWKSNSSNVRDEKAIFLRKINEDLKNANE